jgi:hypothetical protein
VEMQDAAGMWALHYRIRCSLKLLTTGTRWALQDSRIETFRSQTIQKIVSNRRLVSHFLPMRVVY